MELSASTQGKMLLAVLVVVCILLVLQFVNIGVAAEQMRVSRENLEAQYSYTGGLSHGAHLGFASEPSDNVVHPEGRQQQALKLSAEHLVPGNKSWPSPSESNPRRMEFGQSPCNKSYANANTQARANNARGVANALQAGANVNANSASMQGAAGARNASRENLSAGWKELERLSSSSKSAGNQRLGFYEHANSEYEPMNNRASVYDPMANRTRANDAYAPEHMANARGLEDILHGQ